MGLLMIWFCISSESWILLAFILLTLRFAPFQRHVRGIARRVRTETGFFDEDLLEVPEAVRVHLTEKINEAFRSRSVSPTPRVLAQTMHHAWSGASGRPASLAASIVLMIVYATMAVPSMLLFWYSFIVG